MRRGRYYLESRAIAEEQERLRRLELEQQQQQQQQQHQATAPPPPPLPSTAARAPAPALAQANGAWGIPVASIPASAKANARAALGVRAQSPSERAGATALRASTNAVDDHLAYSRSGAFSHSHVAPAGANALSADAPAASLRRQTDSVATRRALAVHTDAYAEDATAATHVSMASDEEVLAENFRARAAQLSKEDAIELAVHLLESQRRELLLALNPSRHHPISPRSAAAEGGAGGSGGASSYSARSAHAALSPRRANGGGARDASPVSPTSATASEHQRMLNTNALSEIAELMSSDLPIARLVDRVVGALAHLVPARCVQFFRVDSATKDLVCQAATHPGMCGFRVPPHGIIGYVAKTARAINIPVAHDDWRFDVCADSREAAGVTVHQLKSLLSVPVRSSMEGGRVVAVIEVLNSERPDTRTGAFRASDEVTIGAIASLTGLVLDKARLRDEVERRKRVATALQHIGELSSTAEFGVTRVIEKMVRACSTLVQAEKIRIYLVHEQSRELVSDEGGPNEVRVAVGEGIVGHVALRGHRANVSDASLDWRHDYDLDSGTKSLLVVPVTDFLGKTVAVIEARNKLAPFNASGAATAGAAGGAPTAASDAASHGARASMSASGVGSVEEASGVAIAAATAAATTSAAASAGPALTRTHTIVSFDIEDEELLTSLATTAGGLLRQAQLYEEMVSHKHDTEALLQISDHMSAGIGTHKVVPRIIAAAYQMVHAERISFFEVQEVRVDTAGGAAALAASANAAAATAAAAAAAAAAATSSSGAGSSSTAGAMLNGVPVASASNFAHARSLSSTSLSGSAAVSAAAAASTSASAAAAATAGSRFGMLQRSDSSSSIASVTSISEFGANTPPQTIKRLVCRVSRDRSFEGAVIPWHHGIVGYVADTHRSLNIPNAYADPRFDRASDLRTGFVTRSILTVPVRARDGRTLAVIQGVNKIDGTAFSHADQVRLEALASSAGIVLQKNLAYAELVRANRKSRALLKLLRVVSERDATLASVVNGIVRVAYEALDADRVTIFAVDKGRMYSMISVDAHGFSFPVGHGIAGHVAATGNSVNVPDAYEFPFFDPSFDRSTGYRTRSVLCVPVVDQDGHVLAVIQALNKQSCDVTSDDYDHLAAPTPQAPSPLSARSSIGRGVAFGGDDGADDGFRIDVDRVKEHSTRRTRGSANASHSGDGNGASGATRRPVSVRSSGEYAFGLNAHHDSDTGDSQSPSPTAGAGGVSASPSTFSPLNQQQQQPSSSSSSSSPPPPPPLQQQCAVFSYEDEVMLTAIASQIRTTVRRYLTDSMLDNLAAGKDRSAQSLVELYSDTRSLHGSRQRSAIKATLQFTQAPVQFEWPSAAAAAVAAWGPNGATLGGASGSAASTIALLSSREFDVWQYSSDELLGFAVTIFMDLGLHTQFNMSLETLKTFVMGVRSRYQDNPFHNWYHGFSVFHFSYMMLKQPGVHVLLTGQDVLALMVSSLCHDIDHPGNTNTYEINSSSERALVHNDISVLENHHAHVTFTLLRTEGMNILESQPREVYVHLRAAMIEAILATDMTRHFESNRKLGARDAERPFDTQSDEERQVVVNTLIHTADLSGQVFPTAVATKWEERISLEFAAQAARESEAGLPVAPFMTGLADARHRAALQVKFIDFILEPWWKNTSRLLPDLKPWYAMLLRNRDYYEEHSREPPAGDAASVSAEAAAE